MGRLRRIVQARHFQCWCQRLLWSIPLLLLADGPEFQVRWLVAHLFHDSITNSHDWRSFPRKIKNITAEAQNTQ